MTAFKEPNFPPSPQDFIEEGAAFFSMCGPATEEDVSKARDNCKWLRRLFHGERDPLRAV